MYALILPILGIGALGPAPFFALPILAVLAYDWITMEDQVFRANGGEMSLPQGGNVQALPQQQAQALPQQQAQTLPDRAVLGTNKAIISEKEQIERELLLFAVQNKETFRVADVVAHTSVTVDEVQESLESLVRKGVLSMDIDDNGNLLYRVR